jgi:nicotinamide-nucleotide amidase
MLAEIITIGDEILIGQIVDTNSAFISKHLNSIGVQVYQITSVQDDHDHILKALNDAMNRVDLVLVTGGLGPTKDDVTKKTFCEFLDDTLVENEEVLAHIREIFEKYTNHPLLPESMKQAYLPSKATILKNDHGTASGMWMEKEGKVFISLPGVPYEMKHLLLEKVLPLISEKCHCPYIYHKTLLTYGMGESEIAKRILYWEENLKSDLKLAYLPSFGRVRLRLSMKGFDKHEVITSVDREMDELSSILADIAVGFEDETSIEQRIAELLVSKKQTLSVAESCTGGAIAAKITERAGASNYFMGGIIPYGTEYKSSILGIDRELISKYTVVSKEVAKAMAIQTKEMFKTDYALATTGIAGPTKGDAIDEVGTVFIAIAGPKHINVERFSFGRSRERVIAKATNKAFEMLLKEIQKN